MIVLLAFAVLAGAATAITPCVLPVLPALLSASGTGGRRRPLGRRLRARRSRTRSRSSASPRSSTASASPTARCARVAIVVLLVFGLTLLVPAASALDRGRGMAVLSRFGPRGARRRLLVGAAGRRRAGLRLRAVRRADPRRGHLGQRLARARPASSSRSAIAYGPARPSCCSRIALGGRRVIERVRRGGRAARRCSAAFGAVMVLTAVLMFAERRHPLPERAGERVPEPS